ncbi:GNAT family protein [Microcoleus sp. FACHB-68]|uniref:GNAT family N-acetyltransferase n=1 Tax=Microcoleus sp. FACHB-68 TaxID=2692826 RepID=UPI0016843A81|nr:GNAT family protein [Microcoleus sp. FACHB-68]MBD1940409.1 GNAT family N-acetyltransferase [Microcoleus sp. FACHB-68]
MDNMEKDRRLLSGYQVCLKTLEAQDLEYIYKWKNDWELARQIKAYPLPIAISEIQEWLKKNHLDKNQIFLGIYLKDYVSIIGVVRLKYIDWISRNAELGLYIGEDKYRGRGLGKEALKLLLNYAFLEINLHKISLTVLDYNVNAIKLYESCGFTKEGVLREQFWVNGKYENVFLMGLLRNEYNQNILLDE